MIAQYDGQCASCGQVFQAGEDIHYYPASGDVGVKTEHKVCPPPSKKPKRGQNYAPQEVHWYEGNCVRCGTEYASRNPLPSPLYCAVEVCAAYVVSKERVTA